MLEPLLYNGQLDSAILQAIAEQAAQCGGTLVGGNCHQMLAPGGMAVVPSDLPGVQGAVSQIDPQQPSSAYPWNGLIAIAPLIIPSYGFDTSGFWSADAPTRLTAPADGIYLTGAWFFAGDEFGPDVQVSVGIYQNGIHGTINDARVNDFVLLTGLDPAADPVAGIASLGRFGSLCVPILMQGGDYLELGLNSTAIEQAFSGPPPIPAPGVFIFAGMWMLLLGPPQPGGNSGNSGGSGNATSLQGVPVSATPPTDGQVLGYQQSSGEWQPVAPSGLTSYASLSRLGVD